MGEFEDLVDKAASGDADAAAALKERYSGSSLRSKAEEGEAAKARYQAALPQLRKIRLDELSGKIDERFRSVIGPDDFTDLEPESITLEVVHDRAERRYNETKAQRLNLAKANGFDTVEDMDAALAEAKKRREVRRDGMETASKALASLTRDPNITEESTPFEIAKVDYEAAKDSGMDDGRALGEFVHSLMAAQHPVSLEEAD